MPALTSATQLQAIEAYAARLDFVAALGRPPA